MGRGTPSSSTRSTVGSTRRPSTGTDPLTVTRPSAMSSSHTRRDPTPIRAITFCSRSPVAGWSAESSPIDDRAHLVLELIEGLGPGKQVLHRWQLVQPVEAETFQKGVRCGVEDGLTRPGSPTGRGDVATMLEQSDHAVHVDSAQGGDLGPRHRLLVGHDGQGLQGRGGETRRDAHVGEPFHVGSQVGMGLDPEAAGDPDHVEAPVPLAARLGQLVAQRVDPFDRYLEELGQKAGGYRFDGHHQDGLDGPGFGRERPGGSGRGHPSYSSVKPTPTGTCVRASGTHPTSRSPKVWPWSREIRPCLHSSSRARKRTMISMREVRCWVRVRNVTFPPMDGSRRASSVTASDTVTVSTVTW